MKEILLSRITLYWVLLTVLTGLTWIIGDGSSAVTGVKYAAVILMVIAAIKVRTIVLHFMEMATAPLPLRVLFEGWVVLVFVVVISLYLFGERLS